MDVEVCGTREWETYRFWVFSKAMCGGSSPLLSSVENTNTTSKYIVEVFFIFLLLLIYRAQQTRDQSIRLQVNINTFFTIEKE